MPVVEGKAVGEDEYDDLSEDVKIKLRKFSDGTGKAGSIMRELRDMDKESKRQTDQLDYKTGMFAIGHHVNAVQENIRNMKELFPTSMRCRRMFWKYQPVR